MLLIIYVNTCNQFSLFSLFLDTQHICLFIVEPIGSKLDIAITDLGSVLMCLSVGPFVKGKIGQDYDCPHFHYALDGWIFKKLGTNVTINELVCNAKNNNIYTLKGVVRLVIKTMSQRSEFVKSMFFWSLTWP